MTQLTISTVTYNSPLLHGALESVSKHAADISVEYIVVDNDSRDSKSIQGLVQRFSFAKFVPSGENLGFGKANNIALGLAQGDYFLIMNPDIEIGESTLKIMLAKMRNHPDIVALGCAIKDQHGALLTSRRRYPHFFTLVSRFFSFIPMCRAELDKYEMIGESFTQDREVDWLSGAFILCRTSSIRKAGGFDPRYFLYFEDVDLCRELRKQGKVVFTMDTFCIHRTEYASRRKFKLLRLHITSAFRYFSKWGFFHRD